MDLFSMATLFTHKCLFLLKPLHQKGFDIVARLSYFSP